MRFRLHLSVVHRAHEEEDDDDDDEEEKPDTPLVCRVVYPIFIFCLVRFYSSDAYELLTYCRLSTNFICDSFE
jgi:hypothetical protein